MLFLSFLSLPERGDERKRKRELCLIGSAFDCFAGREKKMVKKKGKKNCFLKKKKMKENHRKYGPKLRLT
jgi:hypothetical protein